MRPRQARCSCVYCSASRPAPSIYPHQQHALSRRARAQHVTLHSDQGQRVLVGLLNRYLGDTGSPLAQQLLTKANTEVALRLQPHWQSQWDYSRRMADT